MVVMGSRVEVPDLEIEVMEEVGSGGGRWWECHRLREGHRCLCAPLPVHHSHGCPWVLPWVAVHDAVPVATMCVISPCVPPLGGSGSWPP